ncbi:helix-turn-helix transcriptional regulator, partial [Falsihalocynthiibacter sp. S25ZX9]
ELHLRAAQGEFFAMVNLQFDRWGLSKAERDIALLTTKGLSVAEIADLRNTTQGTVKSQNNSIYRKAKVNSRTQLLGALIDELFIEDPIKMNLE